MATIEVDPHPVSGETRAAVLRGIDAALDDIRRAIQALDASVELLSTPHASLIDAGEPIVRAAAATVTAVQGIAPVPGAMGNGHTDQEWPFNEPPSRP